jgi:sodium/proline symporter
VLVSIVAGAICGPGWNALDSPFGVPATFVGVGVAVLGLLAGRYVWENDETVPPGATPSDD